MTLLYRVSRGRGGQRAQISLVGPSPLGRGLLTVKVKAENARRGRPRHPRFAATAS
jgi:hypothetical protein